MQFFSGLLLGAILSVFVDRLWRRYEQTPKFSGCISYFRDVNGEGVKYTIENCSRVAIPDFEITLQHPRFGCLRIFDPDKSGDFLPTQRRVFTCYLNHYKQPGEFKQFLNAFLTHGISELPSELARHPNVPAVHRQNDALVLLSRNLIYQISRQIPVRVDR